MSEKHASPVIIALSVRIYRWLLRLGPGEYRHEYEEPTLQDFRQCCRHAYGQHGTRGVLGLWLPLFYEVIAGMLAERFSVERMRRMLPTMRRSMIMTFGAFIFFGVAYTFLMHVTDPRPPFDAVAATHPDIRLAFAVINWSAEIAFLAVVLGGFPILFSAIWRILMQRRNPLALFAISPKYVLLLVALTFVVEVSFFVLISVAQLIFGSGGPPSPSPGQITPLPPLEIVAQFSFFTFFTFLLLTAPTLVSLAVLRSEFSTRMLHYALIPMAIAVLAMGVSFVATLVWTLLLWIEVPQFAQSQGMGPGFNGGIGGSTGVAVILLMMIAATGIAALALGSGLRSRRFAAV